MPELRKKRAIGEIARVLGVGQRHRLSRDAREEVFCLSKMPSSRVLDDELSAGLPSMGRPERLGKNDLTLRRQFRRLIHGLRCFPL